MLCKNYVFHYMSGSEHKHSMSQEFGKEEFRS